MEESTNERNGQVKSILKYKMPTVQEVKFDLRKVTLVGIRAGGGKYLVVLAPDDKRWRAVPSEIRLHLGI